MKELKKILIAPDKFKDAATAEEVAQAIQKGIHKANSTLECSLLPLADGGEGTVTVLNRILGGEIKYFTIKDPLFREIEAPVLFHENTAYIEMAKASGLQLLKHSERNCFYTSSFGTGQLIMFAIEEGAVELVIGAGGSATCDGGMGMATALGFEFEDQNSKKLKPIGGNLHKINKIITPNWIDKFRNHSFKIACDVNNPLHGSEGAARVYAPQKGASPEQARFLEEGLLNFDSICSQFFNKKISETSGTGAAGGIGAGCMWFLNAELCSGAELILEYVHFTKLLKTHQMVITGEGSLDKQSKNGKVIQKVSEKCLLQKIPAFALCGAMNLTIEEIEKTGLKYAVSINNQPSNLKKALNNTITDLELAAYNLIKAITA